VAEELNTMLRKYIRAKVILGGCSLLFYSAAMPTSYQALVCHQHGDFAVSEM
jgi:hypothetical protein